MWVLIKSVVLAGYAVTVCVLVWGYLCEVHHWLTHPSGTPPRVWSWPRIESAAREHLPFVALMIGNALLFWYLYENLSR